MTSLRMPGSSSARWGVPEGVPRSKTACPSELPDQWKKDGGGGCFLSNSGSSLPGTSGGQPQGVSLRGHDAKSREHKWCLQVRTPRRPCTTSDVRHHSPVLKHELEREGLHIVNGRVTWMPIFSQPGQLPSLRESSTQPLKEAQCRPPLCHRSGAALP